MSYPIPVSWEVYKKMQDGIQPSGILCSCGEMLMKLDPYGKMALQTSKDLYCKNCNTYKATK